MGRTAQEVLLGAAADQQQPVVGGELGQGADQDVEAFAGREPADAADDVRAVGQTEPLAGVQALDRVEAEAVQVDAVGDHLDPRPRHAPLLQALGDRGGHGDRRPAQALAGEIQCADPGGEAAALHLRVAQRVFGGDDRLHARDPGGEPAVDAGAVEVGVDEVVAAGADDPDQAGEGGQVAVAGHAEVEDAHPVGGEAGGDRARVGERHDIAVDRQVVQQQAELLLGAADAESGDDVQGLHASPSTGRRRSRCSRYLRNRRTAVSFWPMWTRGRAWTPLRSPGSIAQA